MTSERKRINATLRDLLIGILFCGIVFQSIGLIVKVSLDYALGLWLGIATAAAMSIHMSWTLERAMEIGRAGAQKKVGAHNLVRYGILLILFTVVLLTDAANPLAAFLGVMSLKIAAYLQPVTNKIYNKFMKPKN